MKQDKKYCIQVGEFHGFNEAMELQLQLLEKGFQCDIIRNEEGFIVKTRSFRELDAAAGTEIYLKFLGYHTKLVTI